MGAELLRAVPLLLLLLLPRNRLFALITAAEWTYYGSVYCSSLHQTLFFDHEY